MRHVAAACLALALLRLVGRALTNHVATWPQLVAAVVLLTIYWVPASLSIGYLYAWLVGRAFDRRRQLVLHVLAAVVVMVTEALWSQWIVRLTTGVRTPMLQWTFYRLDWNALLYLVTVTGFAAARALRIARARERLATELDAALTDAQLHGLALQLQPHFLFNTLLLIAETAYTNADVARDTLAALRTLLRTAYAYGGRRFVTVAEEIAFLEAYAAIQQHRFGNRLDVSFSLDSEVFRATLPPLLLQPLVENSIRHGLSPRGRGGWVRVSVRKSSSTLEIMIEDDGQGFLRGGSPSEGIGLSLTRRRLSGLYGGAAELRMSAREGGGVVARVTLPFSEDLRDEGSVLLPIDDESRAEDWGHTGDFPIVVPDASDEEGDAHLPNVGDRARGWSMGMRLTVGWAVALASILEMHWLGLRLGYYKGEPVSWGGVCADTVSSLPFWTVLTLAAIGINRRARDGALSTRLTLALHVGAATLIASAHALLGARVEQLVWWGSPPAEGLSSFSEWVPWDILAYAIVVGIARRDDLAEWARRRVLHARALRLQVEAAARRLARQRLQQPLLISALEGVANADGPLAIDRASVQFADLVRLMLSSADAESHTLAAEVLLTDYYAVLRTRARGTVSMSRATGEATVPPTVVATVLHALLAQVDDPSGYTIAAEPAGATIVIRIGVTSDLPVPDRSAAGDMLQLWLRRQLDAACENNARLTFVHSEGGVEAMLELPLVAGPISADSPQCSYAADEQLGVLTGPSVHHESIRVRQP